LVYTARHGLVAQPRWRVAPSRPPRWFPSVGDPESGSVLTL